MLTAMIKSHSCWHIDETWPLLKSMSGVYYKSLGNSSGKFPQEAVQQNLYIIDKYSPQLTKMEKHELCRIPCYKPERMTWMQ